MSVIANNILAGASGQGGAEAAYQIERSLRFNSSDSAYLGANFGTPTDQDVFTLSMWAKRSALGSTQQLFGVSTNHSFGFTSGDALNLTFGGSSALTTTALFRDPSAWYHIMWVQNGTAHTLYVNGTSVGTATATSDTFNTAVAHQIGAGNTANFFNGYLADIHFIDGQALAASDFGEFDATTGIWNPIQYSGSYGSNGFKLDFSDNSTAAALGTDTSGNSNTWTVNNISVTAGSGNDSLVDSPTNGTQSDTGVGGEVSGNYATLNPLQNGSNVTLSNGNLDASTSGTNNAIFVSTIGVSSGKWYVEYIRSSGNSNVGITNNPILTNIYLGLGSGDYSYYSVNGKTYTGGVPATYGDTWGDGDIIGIAFDADAGTLYFYKNGVIQNSGTAAFTGLTSGPYFFAGGESGQQNGSWNFGQRPFAYTAPSGYKALCTTNLPTPTIADGSAYMDVVTYNGANQSPRTITGLSFEPDFVWVKNRSISAGHYLWDAVRGTDKNLRSDGTYDESSVSAASNGIISTNSSNGFVVKNGSNAGSNVGSSGSNAYVAWAWDAGSSTVSNTDGSITSSVRANPSAGFSIVTYTCQSSGSGTIGHGLGVAPSLIISKGRAGAYGWGVYHISNGWNGYLLLDTSGAFYTDANAMNNTAPTSTVWTQGTIYAGLGTYVAYCFAPVDGFSFFNSYTGNGSTDGLFVYTGFRPRWIMIKRTNASANWRVLDTARDTYNVASAELYPSISNAEGSFNALDINSNGFKIRTSDVNYNASGSTYIFAAFAENPFKTARAR